MRIEIGKKLRILLVVMVGLLTFGCTNGSAGSNAKPETVSAEQANKIMTSGEAYILLDVRSKEEYSQGHIKGARLIPDFELEKRATVELPDKNALILVYCRSGRRSLASAKLLLELGYTNVKDMGGIIDWPYGIER